MQHITVGHVITQQVLQIVQLTNIGVEMEKGVMEKNVIQRIQVRVIGEYDDVILIVQKITHHQHLLHNVIASIVDKEFQI